MCCVGKGRELSTDGSSEEYFSQAFIGTNRERRREREAQSRMATCCLPISAPPLGGPFIKSLICEYHRSFFGSGTRSRPAGRPWPHRNSLFSLPAVGICGDRVLLPLPNFDLVVKREIGREHLRLIISSCLPYAKVPQCHDAIRSAV